LGAIFTENADTHLFLIYAQQQASTGPDLTVGPRWGTLYPLKKRIPPNVPKPTKKYFKKKPI
jgi:hypothetical protein